LVERNVRGPTIHSPASRFSSAWFFLQASALILLILGASIAFLVWIWSPEKSVVSDERGRHSGSATVSASVISNYIEERMPSHGSGSRHDLFDTCQLIVRPARGFARPLLVKLENTDTNRPIPVWFLSRNGQPAEIPVRPGSYRVKLASGTRWFGETDLFGPDGQYWTIRNTISISERERLILSLEGSPSGTLQKQTIGAKDF
jgi:hypothetical protein